MSHIIHKIVSKERCQSYFIDGCQVRPIRRDARYKNRVNQPRLRTSEVFHSIFAWLVAMLHINT